MYEALAIRIRTRQGNNTTENDREGEHDCSANGVLLAVARQSGAEA
jgi:hypothetical protein